MRENWLPPKAPDEADELAAIPRQSVVVRLAHLRIQKDPKLANIAFLTKDPLANIANVKTVTLTVKRGQEFPRRNYRPITKDESKNAE